MHTRNRSEGWQYAKLSGHQNEESVEYRLNNDDIFAREFLKRIGRSTMKIDSTSVGGLKEVNVDSIQGGTTKSKSDICVTLSNNERINISLKKSGGGQVYLVTVANFIDVYENHFGKISANIKRAIELFWGSATDTECIINQFGKNKRYEKRKHRLVAETLMVYDNALATALIAWVKNNIGNIVDLCFSRGAAKNNIDWAHYIWYKNELGEEGFDDLFPIDQIKIQCENNKDMVRYGTRNNGSTIQLPFGFVQWHSPSKIIPGCIQFHHKYKLIKAMFDNDGL